ncbi:MAG: DUF2182 domain-containing protein [Myxococcales bacterium]|nr:DUF2182 domain-containing protein [Myxococcales bacterium]
MAISDLKVTVPPNAARAPGALAVTLILLALAALAWVWTLDMAAMSGMDGMGDHGAMAPLPFAVMWTVMMAAMMFPALVPTAVAYRTLARPRASSLGLATAALVTGYLVVWGLLAFPALGALRGARALADAVPAFARWSGVATGAALVLCGLYQFGPWKDRCLGHCRMPHLYLAHHWRDGVVGALFMGAHHGVYCTGCCASLMAVLLVVGVMDVAWMVGLTALIFAEKLLPGGPWIGRAAGLGLVALGALRVLG